MAADDIQARLKATRTTAPRYDQAKDGNPFVWIIQQAAATRAKKQATRPQIDYLTGKVKP